LPEEISKALTIAARLHDEGKKAKRWQQAFNAPEDMVYAKTRGPINFRVLSGYRHEFGSLPYAERDSDFQGLPAEMKDLVLHLIAAHHGRALRRGPERHRCHDPIPSTREYAKPRSTPIDVLRVHQGLPI
jgi:CRISPR-associated endonuclease/helicase Cas3